MEKPSRSRSPEPAAFGIKDLFTTINVLGGAAGIFFCVEGRPAVAGVAVLTGYFLGDILDGWVARKLGTANRFGAEYDTIADHLAHCIAPGAIVYTVYRDAPLGVPPLAAHLIGAALGAAIMVAASIRHARNVVRPVIWKGAWAGLPRTILGFVAIGYANSQLAPRLPGGYWLGVPLVGFLCFATLTYLPYPNHRLPRRHWPYVRVLIAGFFLTTIAALIAGRAYVFDVLFFWTFGYTATSWLALTAEERRSFRAAVAAALSAEEHP